MSVPIATSPGRSGFGPQLSLTYDSGAGNGPFGFGWTLSLPAITRKTDKGLPRYRDGEESDVFVLSGAEDLVPELDAAGSRHVDRTTAAGYTVHRYRPRIEGLFARIERWTSDTDPDDVHWRSISRDNVLTIYGKDAGSRIADPQEPGRIFSWLISESRDDKGNAVVYVYRPENGAGVDLTRAHERNRGGRDDVRRTANRYLKRILYGNRVPLLDGTGLRPRRVDASELASAGWMFEAVLDYGEHDADAPRPEAAGEWPLRNDPFSSYRAGFEVRACRLCQRVLMFHHIPDLATGEPGYDGLVRSTDFGYSYEQLPDAVRDPVYSVLRSVVQSGYRPADGGYLKRSLPPLELEYTLSRVQSVVQEVDPESLENLPVGLDERAFRWVDLHGDGAPPGILIEQGETWYYKRNLSPISSRAVELAPLERVAAKPSVSLAGGGAQLMDLAGDGQLDVVVADGPAPGLFEHDEGEGWQTFRPFTSRLNRDLGDPNLRLVDLDGDGHADVLITEEAVFTWHASLGEAGFGPPERVAQALDEEQGPRLIFAEPTQSIHLADMSGDGLTDLVRIRNGEICYWPNLGYGRFGAKVTMDGAPWFDSAELFDQQRLRLADIDGSGTTDLVYLHRDGVRLYFNQSGNGWSPSQTIAVFPRTDDLAAVSVLDLRGNGTACLVWSSPLPANSGRQMRFVDLMGGTKPHLLAKVTNNLGAETVIEYAPSAKFYLQDRRDGRPWVTRLPFPVHVVERIVTYDHISRNRFVTRYAYHHGYFDGEEREFRGFGMVEQWDTEEFGSFEADGLLEDAANLDGTSHVPPVLTKTWFHTGAFVDRDRVSTYFAGLLDDADTGEYYREPGQGDTQARGMLLEDTILPSGLSADEEREACRALKGSMLRQEVYARDRSAREAHPYTVTEQSFAIRLVQPRGRNRHAVFFTHPREAVTYHYERDPADPRVSHALTLKVDRFGNVERAMTVAYRRRPAAGLTEPEYKETHLTLTVNRFASRTDAAGWYRVGEPAEMSSYEVVQPPSPTVANGTVNLFPFAQLDDLVHNPATGLLPLATMTPALAKSWPSESWDWRDDPARSPAAGDPRLRLVEQRRIHYRPDDLGSSASDPERLLPLGTVESHALAGESYRLALTPGLLSRYMQREGQPLLAGASEAALLGGQGGDQGGYVDLDGDGRWWTPSGRIFYSPRPADTPAQELAYARQHFLLPHRYRDPFHTNAVSTDSFITYDIYDLLIEETRDALDNRVTVGERNVVPTQPLVRRAQDYRVLQPALVMDPNRNRSAVAFDALGMVVGTAVMGKPEEAPNVPGDRLSASFRRDLTQAEIDQLVANPKGPIAASLLDEATTRVVYDLTAYWREPDSAKKPPAVTATLARETHASEPVPTGGLRIQVSLSYSDGFGREIQKKIQAEPGPVPTRDTAGKIIVGADGQPVPTPNAVSPRWVGSGWTVFNNKGKPVRRYEPFFSDTHRFEFDVRIGVSPVLFYDPVERVVATLHPNHTWEKVVFHPWRQETWDVNDTMLVADPGTDADVGDLFGRLEDSEYLPTWHALRTDGAHVAAFAARYPDATDRTNETRAAEKTRAHASTPAVAYADSLGRTFLTVAHNRAVYSDPSHPSVDETHSTRIVLDIEGNQRKVIDAKDRVAMHYDFDLLGNRVHQASMEAGERWMLNDVAGKPLYAWDSRDHRFRTAYDPLRRPTDSYLTEGAGDESRIGQTIYGETHPGYPVPETGNLRGRVVEIRDQAGVVVSDDYDFKGNLRESRRRLARDFKSTLDWLWPGTIPLETETYARRSRYDALNRPTQLIAPHSDQAGATVNVIQPSYNEANLLEQVHAWLNRNARPADLLDPASADLHAVADIDYDAKGQRTLIDCGNGVRTTYRYDPMTFRLTHLLTRRGATDFPGDCPQPPPAGWPGCQVQNLHYSYDPVGNITHIRDGAQQTVYFKNRRVDPSAEYTYDAVYRLIEARGREHLGQAGGSPMPHSYSDSGRVGMKSPGPGSGFHPHDGDAIGRYCECYEYDAVGNIMEMIHRLACPGTESWRRSYTYAEDSQLDGAVGSNRLSSTTIGATTETYSSGGGGYDAHGNMLRMPHLQVMQWDFRDQLHMTRRQRVNDQDTDGVLHHGERTWYVYDSDGQRVRKVTEKNGEIKDERLYLGGFDIYRNPADHLVRETLHVMDGTQRIAMVETRTQGHESGVPLQIIRYQFGDYLGSASLELDDQAQIISYEEYTPYGSTSYQAVRSRTETPKRYRYTGKERDEESGLYYHGARYYASWLGLWCSSDPAGIEAGLNLYQYCLSNPTRFVDSSGLGVKDKLQYWAGNIVGALHAIVGYKTKRELNRNVAAGYALSQEVFGWQKSKTVQRIRDDIVKNPYSSKIMGTTLGLMSGFVPGAPSGDDLPESMQRSYKMMRFASTNATAIVGGVEMLQSVPPPSTPPMTPAPALVTTTSHTIQASGTVPLTASAPGPLALAVAVTGNDVTKKTQPAGGGGKKLRKATRQFSGDKVPYQVTGLEKDLKAVRGTGVYVLKDSQGNVLYVGEGNVFDRLRAHISDPKKTPWFGEISQLEVHATRLLKKESLALEEDLISQLRPLHNKQMRPFEDAFPGQLRGADTPKPQRVLRFDVELGKR